MTPRQRIRNYNDLLRAKQELELSVLQKEERLRCDFKLLKTGWLFVSDLRNGQNHWKKLALLFGKQAFNRFLPDFVSKIIQQVQGSLFENK